MSRLTRDGTAEPVSQDQILRHERGQGNIHFSCSADHMQDWQPYPVDPYSCYMCDHTYSQGYHGVVGGLGLGLGLAVGWLQPRWVLGGGVRMTLPHRCGDSAVPVAAPRQDCLGCTINPTIALRRATHSCMYCDQPGLQTRDPGGGVNKRIPRRWVK